jgi:hypothetical protein
MKLKFSVRGANYTTAIFISPEDSQKDVAWIMRVVMPRSDRLHVD